MRILLAYLAVVTGIAIIFYLAGSFVAGTWNSGHWDNASKAFSVCIMILIDIVVAGMFVSNKKTLDIWLKPNPNGKADDQ